MGLSKPSTPVKDLRVKANVSRAQVAVALGLKTEKTVERWETGRTQPSLTPWQMYTLLKLYQCSLEELVAAFYETAPDKYLFITGEAQLLPVAMKEINEEAKRMFEKEFPDAEITSVLIKNLKAGDDLED